MAMVGQAVEHRLIKVALDGPPSAVRASSSSPTPSMRWASSVQPSSASSLEQVRIFLAGGVVVDDPGMLETDDTVYFSVDGGPWHEPGVAPTRMSLFEYRQKETGTRSLVGKVATELSTNNYGSAEWWLLLDPVPAAS